MKENYQSNLKTVVITGAASGIGKELSSLFIAAGATVVLFDINRQNLETTANELTDEYNKKIYSMQVDVTDYDGFKQAVNEVVEKIGPVDIFINNAGIGISGEFIDNSAQEIDSITSVNYLGMVYGSHIILQHFRERGQGHLVNVASVAGFQGFPRMSLYCGTKAGIITFSQGIRFELKKLGIDISLALPSTTDTPMIMDKLDGPDEQMPGVLMAIPMCKKEDVALAIFNGIKKKKFMIFPTLIDRMTLFTRNFTPGLFSLGISVAGFMPFKWKRNRLAKQYDLDK